jgi:hypothetical protein
MSAFFAGVLTAGVRQFDYLTERLEEIPAYKSAAIGTACRVGAGELELVGFAKGAAQEMYPNANAIFHNPFLSAAWLPHT